MGTTHLSGLQVSGVPTMGISGLLPFTGNYYFVDYASGSDGATGTADDPFKTIYRAYAAMTDGNNDVCIIVPGPIAGATTTGTQRLSTAIAQTITASATTGTLTWAKNACHLIGLAGPNINSRARIAPPTGTYTAATFGNSGNMVNVTAQGCIFANFSIYGGFSTGATGCFTWIDAGGRNSYLNVSFLGLNDAASAGDTGSASLKISGSTGEHTFRDCMIGDDTTTRSVANYSMVMTGGSPRNRFINCIFPSMVSSGTASAVQIAASGIDRWALFDNCLFVNDTLGGPGSSTITDVFSNNAATGGMVVLKNSTMVGYTGWALTAANVLIDGAAPTAASSGIAVAVSA